MKHNPTLMTVKAIQAEQKVILNYSLALGLGVLIGALLGMSV